MRLLRRWPDNSGFSLVEHVGNNIPPYAILSHTWGPDDEEVTFKDLMEGSGKSKPGYRKLSFCGRQAAQDGLEYFWVDTCCIDKSSSAELAEAINSMFKWYQKADRCYVLLSDLPISRPVKDISQQIWAQIFQHCRWFQRGWTLQELLAPPRVDFFSKEGEWIGNKVSLMQALHSRTRIPVLALQGNPLSQFSVDERMSWAKERETRREEDVAYSILGIFGIHMSLIYGEGQEKALARLRRKVNRSEKDRPLVKPPKSSWTVPFMRDDDFINRDSLDKVCRICVQPAGRAALVGLGGVG
jgi:hypothetical protein